MSERLPVMMPVSDIVSTFKVSRYLVRMAIVENKIPYIKSGKKYLISRDRFIEYLSNGECMRHA